MRSLSKILVVCFLVIGLTGCYNLRPNVAQPGPKEVQRARAVIHDPWPDTNAGPEMLGVRPHDYMKPNAEPVRNQPFSNWLWSPSQ